MAVAVRQAALGDRPAITRFLWEAYGTRASYKVDDRWMWQFVRNPYRRETNGRAPVWVALDGERVIGQIAVQPARLRLGDETVDAGWIVDVMILPEHRGGGLGHRLHDGVTAGTDVLVTLTMAPATRRIAERAGALTLGEVHQFSRWARLDAETVRRYLFMRTVDHPLARRLVRVGCRAFAGHRVIAAVANPFLRLRDALEWPYGPPDVSVSEVDRFGEDVDRLWAETRSDYDAIFERDSVFLNWRFVDCPGLRYRRFVARREGRTVGYVVLRRSEPVELRQGIVADLYAARGDTGTLDVLVRHALTFFGNDVATVECATSIPEYRAVLRKHGFLKTRTERPTVVCRDPRLRAKLEQSKDAWFLSKADHDWDQIHLA
jgi:GNAT superfamily N-acetyltransferase